MSDDITTFIAARLAEEENADQPAAVLREIEATRLLVALHRGDYPYDPDAGDQFGYSYTEVCQRCGQDSPCEAVRLVASRWSSHPDHRPEWTP